MKQIVFIILASLITLSAPAQRAAKTFHFEPDDTAVVYMPEAFQDFSKQLMCERPHRRLTVAECDSLNAWFKSLHTETVYLNSALDEKLLFVEIRPKEEDRCGLYILPEGIRLVSEDSPYVRYAHFPKNIKGRVREFIKQFYQTMPTGTAYSRYDHLPMCSAVRRHITELLRSEGCEVRFYVLIDTVTVYPIDYSISYSKKKGVKRVSRNIQPLAEMPYASTNDQGMILIHRPFGRVAALGRQYDHHKDYNLDRCIPNWSQMTDAERMRWLDDWIIGHQQS